MYLCIYIYIYICIYTYIYKYKYVQPPCPQRYQMSTIHSHETDLAPSHILAPEMLVSSCRFQGCSWDIIQNHRSTILEVNTPSIRLFFFIFFFVVLRVACGEGAQHSWVTLGHFGFIWSSSTLGTAVGAVVLVICQCEAQIQACTT